MFSQHVTKQVSAFCHGELSAEESRHFKEHIIACSRCRASFEEIKLGIRWAEQLPELSAPSQLWEELEVHIGNTPASISRQNSFLFPSWKVATAAIAAVLAVVAAVGVWWVRSSQRTANVASSWEVQRINGRIRIGSADIENKGRLGIGQWLETDSNSRAEIAVSSIGRVEVDADTRVRLLQTQPNEHRLELARGKMSAQIWAPPRLFFVDTPSAVAADLGCAYTLEVDDNGASLLRVTAGWVALQLKDRESMVPAGAACQTKPGIGPGTPYFEDCAPEFLQSLTQIDFDSDLTSRRSALTSLLNHTRKRDTLTLWHLLGRVDGDERGKVYEKMASLAPPPDGVTREGVLSLDQRMLDLWRDQLESGWGAGTLIPKGVAETYWRVRNGVQRRVNKLK